MRTVEQLRAALRETDDDFDQDTENKKATLAELATHGTAAVGALPEVIACLGHGHYEVTNAAIDLLDVMDHVLQGARRAGERRGDCANQVD